MRYFTGKNEEEALLNALKEENCERKDFTYAVISEEKHLFGIGNTVTIEGFSNADIKEFIFDYLGSYFTDLNLPTSIEIFVDDEGFRVVLDSDNNAVIIGRGGQTLRAINMVLRSAINTEFSSEKIHSRFKVTVDVNNYREDRYRKLKAVAIKVAKEVSRTHIDASLDPMPNDERKAIHQCLGDFKHIATNSIGEGKDRHIVIRYIEDSETKEA